MDLGSSRGRVHHAPKTQDLRHIHMTSDECQSERGLGYLISAKQARGGLGRTTVGRPNGVGEHPVVS